VLYHKSDFFSKRGGEL